MSPLPLLTIAGSDSGGAAGLQADLKTWTALGQNAISVYGMSAITAVTAQNSARVAAVHYLPPEFVAAQIDAVLSDYGAAAIKTGFLGRVDIIEAVADRLAYWREDHRNRVWRTGVRSEKLDFYVVIDPVLVNHRGEPMFGPEVAAAYRELLFPLADLVTPNGAEAALLNRTTDDGRQTTDHRSSASPEVLAVGRGLSSVVELGAARVLLKSWRRDGTEIVDVFWDGGIPIELPQPRINTTNTHGSGDTLSAAVCAFVAMGYDWLEAIRRAQAYTHEAIRRGAGWRLGAGHGPLGH
jgi:hydroxymethylpyrimidine/phosphomethylpyrimidine kinase